jgi:hypothetical protein
MKDGGVQGGESNTEISLLLLFLLFIIIAYECLYVCVHEAIAHILGAKHRSSSSPHAHNAATHDCQALIALQAYSVIISPFDLTLGIEACTVTGQVILPTG